MQCKRIIRIAGILQAGNLRKNLLCSAVCACKNNHRLFNFLNHYFNRTISIQHHCCIQDRSSMLHTIRRRIAPATSPVYTNREIYGNMILFHFCICIIAKPFYRSGKNPAANSRKTGIQILFLKAGQYIINSALSAELIELCLA